jgi:hypothetical protein
VTNVEIVRLLIGDTAAPPSQLFTDAQIQGFLDVTAAGGVENVFLAAAMALRSLSSSAVLLHKAEKIGNYSLDRKSMSAAYLKAAEDYEAKANSVPAVAVAEFSWTPFNAADIIINDALRNL